MRKEGWEMRVLRIREQEGRGSWVEVEMVNTWQRLVVSVPVRDGRVQHFLRRSLTCREYEAVRKFAARAIRRAAK